MKHYLCIISMLLCNISYAWDGTDQYSNTVEIERNNLVRTGRDIEVYVNGEYKDVEVQSIHSYGSGVEIEVYDHNSGEYNTYNMD